jgi:glucosamine 6-phosphate synthetase-like amidotransferase/phosphosugar isomerase protein
VCGNGEGLQIRRAEGKLRNLEEVIRLKPLDGTYGIGHTRWATHGRPTVVNAHPHRDCTGRIHIIHNGIIENYRELRVELAAAGHEFISDTDTEVVPHLIEQYYVGDLAGAVRTALQRIRGAYALVAVCADEPERIVVGLPLTLRGEHGAQAVETEEFVQALEAAVDVPVERFDERFTSTLAGPAAGSDARAAAHLLDGYLTWSRSRP